MAIGTYTSFRVYNDEFYGGMNETLEQNATAFNGASQNAIRLVTQAHKGHFHEDAFFTSIGSGLVSRRDISSTSAATDTPLASDTFIGPKLNRKVGPVANTIDSLRKIEISPERFSFLLGQQVAQAKLEDYLNTLITAGVACFLKTTSGGPSGLGSFIDKSGSASNILQYDYLAEGLQTFGDQQSRVVAWVMHSVAFLALIKESISIATDRVAGAAIYSGTAGTMGRPVIVTDSDNLIKADGISAGVDSYYTLGLTSDALVAMDSEEDEMVSDVVTGTENLVLRIQGEHAFNVGVKGFSYTSTTANPTNTAVGTGSNWTLKVDSVKSTGGFIIEHA